MMTPLEALQQFCPEDFVVLQERAGVKSETAPQERLSSGDETETSSTAAPSDNEEEDDEDEDDKAPNHFICPLTLQVMRDPVLSRYGQNYERNAILEWLTSSQAHHGSCPLTRRPLELRGLVSNHNLRRQIRQWQRAQQQHQQQHDPTDMKNSSTPSSFDDDDDEPNQTAAARCGVYGSSYYLLDWNDQAEHTEEDPPLILEYRRDETAATAASSAGRQSQQQHRSTQAENHQRRRHRRGFLGRLRRVVGASRAGA